MREMDSIDKIEIRFAEEVIRGFAARIKDLADSLFYLSEALRAMGSENTIVVEIGEVGSATYDIVATIAYSQKALEEAREILGKLRLFLGVE